MNISKLATFTLFPLTLALLSGCALKKKTADSASVPAAASPMAAEPAKAPAPPVLQDVTIRSTPSGAKVLIDGSDVGVTPLVAQLNVAAHYDLAFLLPGYLVSSQTVQARAFPTSIGVGKAGLTSTGKATMPSDVRVSLSVDRDPAKALASAIVTLDSQLSRGQITPAIYKLKIAEVTRFYSQGK